MKERTRKKRVARLTACRKDDRYWAGHHTRWIYEAGARRQVYSSITITVSGIDLFEEASMFRGMAR